MLLALELTASGPVARWITIPLLICAYVSVMTASGPALMKTTEERPWGTRQFWETAAYTLVAIFVLPRLLNFAGAKAADLLTHTLADEWIVKSALIGAAANLGLLVVALTRYLRASSLAK